jgi:beta-glucosidase
MASFNSVNGVKVHGDYSLLTDLLRTELQFDGLVVSDWEAIHKIAPNFK